MFQTQACGSDGTRCSSGSGKLPVSPEYTIWHAAPPCDDERGWIELEDVPLFNGSGATYTLTHTVLISQTYLFDPRFLRELRAIQPIQPQAPRYSWRYMADKMMFALRNTTEGWCQYENASMTRGIAQPFGFYAKTWYSITGTGPPEYLDIEHSPDWGASFDAWNAVFMQLYAQVSLLISALRCNLPATYTHCLPVDELTCGSADLW